MFDALIKRLYFGECKFSWSSYVLDQTWHKVLCTPNHSIQSIYESLYSLLGENGCGLTSEIANFIRALTLSGRSVAKESYQSEQFSAFIEFSEGEITSSQAYLIANLVHPSALTDSAKANILAMLEHTNYADEVNRNFAED